MRRIFLFLIIVLVLMLVGCVGVVSALTACDADVNGDARVNVLDMIAVRNKINNDFEIGDNWMGDVNEDGSINILDMIYVRNNLNEVCLSDDILYGDSRVGVAGVGGWMQVFSESSHVTSEDIILQLNLPEHIDNFPRSVCRGERMSFELRGDVIVQPGPYNTYRALCLTGSLPVNTRVALMELDFGSDTIVKETIFTLQRECNPSDFSLYYGLGQGFEGRALVDIDLSYEIDRDAGSYAEFYFLVEGVGSDSDKIFEFKSPKISVSIDENCECTSGACCAIGAKEFKSSGSKPTGKSDGYSCSGSSSETGTSYVKKDDYYCNGDDADWHLTTITQDICGDCEYCTDGDMTCNYYSSDSICDFDYGGYVYGCYGQSLGDDVFKQNKMRFCSGSSSGCNGRIELNTEVVYDDCNGNEFCDDDNSGSNAFSCSNAQCTSGACCDVSPGSYDFKLNEEICSGTDPWKEYGCPWGINLGTDVGGRWVYDSCSGTSSLCNGGVIRQNWFVDSDCSLYQYCDGSSNSFFCNTICTANSDCPNDGWYDFKCDSEDVWGTYKDFSCVNPGTVNARCVSDEEYKRKEDCADASCDDWGSNYCKGLNVYHKRSCDAGGCSGGGCSSVPYDEEELVEECASGCSNGECKISECDLDSDCGFVAWFGNRACVNRDVWEHGVAEYKCLNLGTAGSSCIADGGNSLRKKQECGDSSCDDWGEDYCRDNDVYHKKICHNRGCKFSSYTCYTTAYDYEDKVEECGIGGCVDGACAERNPIRFNLKKGSNLFSLPYSHRWEIFFGELKSDCNVMSLEYYVPTDDTSGKNYVSFLGRSYSILVAGQGYRINVTGDCYVEMDFGEDIAESDLGFRGEGLKTGWNLIGAPTEVESFDAGTCSLYAGVGIIKYTYGVGRCSEVAGWNGVYEYCPGDGSCRCSVNQYEPGEGYWIRTKNNCVLG